MKGGFPHSLKNKDIILGPTSKSASKSNKRILTSSKESNHKSNTSKNKTNNKPCKPKFYKASLQC